MTPHPTHHCDEAWLLMKKIHGNVVTHKKTNNKKNNSSISLLSKNTTILLHLSQVNMSVVEKLLEI